ncbi:MAG: HAD-IC family P-type ATPase, partial [Patescibacteria group bacterium]
MAKRKVIIKRLDAIQNFGAMDVLCTDKTGTLTKDEVAMVKHCDVAGREDEAILRDAYLTSAFQTGLNNVLEQAVLKAAKLDLSGITKVDEIPFDFTRKILSVVVDINGRHRLITKGAPEEVFKRSTQFFDHGQVRPFSGLEETKIIALEQDFSRQGFRVLAVAYRNVSDQQATYTAADEHSLVFAGFVAFLDPPKDTAVQAIRDLESLGITLKVLSGDNELVNAKIGRDVGLPAETILTGREVDAMNDDELRLAVDRTTIFARVTPIQKERIIQALQRAGHNVGYMGDGINDAPALKAADVGLSVDNAVDIAKENADIILMEKNLLVLSQVVTEGRKTFANSLKYIKMGASSNFGNMLSVTGASIFLPFLPMLPTQILLNNFLYDLSQVAIPT